jgi:Ca2+-binding RTX toxin-like protein
MATALMATIVLADHPRSHRGHPPEFSPRADPRGTGWNIPGCVGVLVVVQPLTTISRGRLASLAVMAGVAALAVPAAANATVTTTINANAVTLTGDAAADNIVLTQNAAGLLTHNIIGGGLNSSTDFDPVTPLDQTVQAANATVTVNGGGGNDTINLSAIAPAAATINGDDGDDIITGSASTDTISGGLGNDRITGFKNTPNSAVPEPISGDDGNDVMIWNNGDGDDLDDGGNGVDETLITAGTADDDMNVTAPTAGRVLFKRVNAPFSVDMGTVEKLSITSFSGNDKLTTAPGITLPMSIDAGAGDDTITTGDGNDVILGGDGNDVLNGAGGGDRIVGERGNDTMNGGAGDDTEVWNNGDGTDVMNGDDGTDRIEDNLGAADDISSLKPENGRVRYDRTNAPFSLSIGSSEVFELNTFGGNDTLATTPGIGIQVVADAGPGNDTFTGADENDTYFGGAGDDNLNTGAGNDVADGGDGNDLLTIRDNAADLARGGAGTDTAIADAATVDAIAADVEFADRTVVFPAPGAGVAQLARTAKVTKGKAALKLSCPAGTNGCSGQVVLFTAKSVKLGKVKAQLTLGRAVYSLKAGETKTLNVKLASGAARLATKKKLAATALVSDSAKTTKVTLSFRK